MTFGLFMGILHIFVGVTLHLCDYYEQDSKKNGRQVNPINFNILLGDWAKTKRCLTAANHPWPKCRCVYQSQGGSCHHQPWSWFHPKYGSCTCNSSNQLSEPLFFSKMNWEELELTMPRALPCARPQHGNFPDGRGYSFKLQAHTTCQLSGQSAALALAAGQPVT